MAIVVIKIHDDLAVMPTMTYRPLTIRTDEMTIIRGSRIFAAPCCGAQYAFPNYVTMNFSAFEYWTDGWNDGVLMPRDYGIRLCNCGRFVLRKDLIDVSTSDEPDLPHMAYVVADRIDACIATADSREMEIAARDASAGMNSIILTVSDTGPIATPKKPLHVLPGKRTTLIAARFGNV